MAKDLNWFQARALGRVQGKRVRRDAWRKWLEFDRTVFLWFIVQPAGQSVVIGGVENSVPESRHVVLASEFESAEFHASDWTDEGWALPGQPGGSSGDIGGGSASSGSGGSSGSETGGDNEVGSGGGGGSGEAGGGSPGPTPPDNSGGSGSDSGGAGSWIIGGGGGGTGGGGGGGKKPPKPPPPQADYTPTVELELDADVDGPGCFIEVPIEGTAYVNVSVPNPAGGTALILGLTVTCLGQTKTQTVGPGTSTAFTFKGPIGPDGTVRATATARDFKGHWWTGADEDKWAPRCLLPIFTWSGTKIVVHRCNHSSGPEDGFDVAANYSIAAQYAVNPVPGTGKTAFDTGVVIADDKGNNTHETTTPYPGGSPTTVDCFTVPPGTITCDVASGGVITNVAPASLNLYPPSGTSTTGTPPDDCTETTTASEAGPNGPE